MNTADRDWEAIIREVDRVTARAAMLDRERRSITPDELAQGFSELAKLRHGGEPDYNARGLGTAYLLYYLARRALNTADACLSLGELSGNVQVLDIGAGTNAGALALAVAFPGVRFHVAAVEPSDEMARRAISPPRISRMSRCSPWSRLSSTCSTRRSCPASALTS